MTAVKGAATPAAPTRPQLSLVKNPAPDPTETPAYQELRVAAATAALHAGAHSIHAPFATWTGLSNGTATALVDDDLRLTYTPGPGQFTALAHCPHGHGHSRDIATQAELDAFRHDLAHCTSPAPRADQPQEHPQT
ncbi:hypothetical protein [Streptomyces asiaticus]|uniref:hypothetical protein n=1 Tax=Streptomyces asiaticus TaxID=114695 RepID=UPI003803BFF9